MSSLTERLARVRARIEAVGGDPARIRIIAVTKGFDAAVVQAALQAGLVDVGESYVQELEAKAAAAELDAAVGPCWHFVGRLQRNKVRKAAPLVSWWHSIDRLPLGAEVARQAPGARVLAQVNLTGEPTKSGCAPDALPALVTGLTELGLDVRGLMTIGPPGPPQQARATFAALSRCADELELEERSMGMSNDLEVAVQEGATMVRVGSALFGPRPGRAGVRH